MMGKFHYFSLKSAAFVYVDVEMLLIRTIS